MAQKTLSYEMSVLKAKVEKFNTLSMCMHLAERLFQKAPELIDQLQAEVEPFEQDSVKSLCRAQNFIYGIIEKAVQGKISYNLPHKSHNYKEFLDLAWLVLNVDVPKTMKWYTFGLKNYEGQTENEFLGSSFRKLLKKQFPSTHRASVQIELNRCLDRRNMPAFRVFLSFSVIRKTKKESKDLEKLLKISPTFIAFYLGEPYFFSNRIDPEPMICEALCKGFKSSGYFKISLSGSHLASLHQMRFNRDNRRTQELIGDETDEKIEREHYISLKNEELMSNPLSHEIDLLKMTRTVEPLPILESITFACEGAKFQEDEVIQSLHGGRLPKVVENLSFHVTMKSGSVLESIREMARNRTDDVFVDPIPNCFEQAANRGRNFLTLKRMEHEDDMSSRLDINDPDDAEEDNDSDFESTPKEP